MAFSVQAGLKVLVIGRAGMDLAPEPAGTSIDDAVHFKASLGGSAANIAAGLSRLGAQAALLTAISDDAAGDWCVRQLEAFGISAEHVSRKGNGSRLSLALTEARLEDHRTIIYRNNASDLLIDANDCERIDWDRYNTLVITGTALALEPSRSAVFAALGTARKHGVTCVLDVDYRPYSWASEDEAGDVMARAAAQCAIIVGNEEEFALLARGGDSMDAARRFGMDGDHLAIYKMGHKGSIAFHEGREAPCPAFHVEALKPTGAGDAFMAAFLHALSSGADLISAQKRGAAAAALVVSREGCAPAMPRSEEIETFLKTAGVRDAHSAL